MFQKLVTVEQSEGSLFIYNLAAGEYKFYYQYTKWDDPEMSSNHEQIQKILDDRGIEFDDLETLDLDFTDDDTVILWMEH